MQVNDKCSTKGCKEESILSFLGKPMCNKCWKKHCNSNSSFENERVYDEVKGASGQKTLLSVLNKPKLDPWDMDDVFAPEEDSNETTKED